MEALFEAAARIGTLETVLLFVVFVEAIVILRLIDMLRSNQAAQAELNATMVDNLIGIAQSQNLPQLGKKGSATSEGYANEAQD